MRDDQRPDIIDLDELQAGNEKINYEVILLYNFSKCLEAIGTPQYGNENASGIAMRLENSELAVRALEIALSPYFTPDRTEGQSIRDKMRRIEERLEDCVEVMAKKNLLLTDLGEDVVRGRKK